MIVKTMLLKRRVVALAVLLLSAFQAQATSMTHQQAVSLLSAYAEIAGDAYQQALDDARQLQQSIDRLAAKPGLETLDDAKKAWLQARESYGVTEIFRLSNGPIDAEEGWVAEAYGALEGQLNAWPLDENMIDYTIDANGQRTEGNIIDSVGVFTPGGEDARAVDVARITAESISELNENGGEANVASGYHAIEFLLWGQDQDYANFTADKVTQGPLTAGQRPLSDFTTDRHAVRRLAYLQAAAVKLVDDLSVVNSAWQLNTSEDCDRNAGGCYRAALLGQLKSKDASKNIDPQVALRQIIAGMGVFIKSELANERIAVAVLTPSEEDEHSCFSDNTHRDISLNYQGFVNVLKAQMNGRSYGPSLFQKASPETRAKIDTLIAQIDSKIKDMNELARTTWHFDYQILPNNNAREIRRMKNDMRKLGDQMVKVAADIGLSLTTDDVTDAEETKI